MKKAIVEFIRQTSILKKVSIVQKQLSKTTYRNFYNKDELVEFIQQFENLVTSNVKPDAVLYVRCACNYDFIYTTYNDIPETNVDCRCGQKVIEYSL
ncbi:MAG: hypothetical protein Q7R33_02005 [Nitrosarchaeum sp.]|nr:hypothetical protein [Nitrosarchaeum sp.]